MILIKVSPAQKLVNRSIFQEMHTRFTQITQTPATIQVYVLQVVLGITY